MRKYDQPKQNKRQPSKAWRKKYHCKKNKGNHRFVLSKPNWNILGENQTPEEHHITEKMISLQHPEYHRLEQEKGILIHWECTDCGKHAMDFEKEPDKQIRDNLYEKIEIFETSSVFQ